MDREAAGLGTSAQREDRRRVKADRSILNDSPFFKNCINRMSATLVNERPRNGSAAMVESVRNARKRLQAEPLRQTATTIGLLRSAVGMAVGLTLCAAGLT